MALAASQTEAAALFGRSKSFLGNGMQPEVVAVTLAHVEDEWRAQAAVFANCQPKSDGKEDSSIVNCADAPSSFDKSCRTVVNAIIEGSGGDKDVAKEYMADVCSQHAITGWHQEQCHGISAKVRSSMSVDKYQNRMSFNSQKLCSGFWTELVGKEKKQMAAELAEREAAEKKAAEEAAQNEKQAEEQAKERAGKQKELEAARTKKEAEDKALEAKAKAAASAAKVAEKKAEAEAVALSAKRKMAEAEAAEKAQKRAASQAAAVAKPKESAPAAKPAANPAPAAKVAEKKPAPVEAAASKKPAETAAAKPVPAKAVEKKVSEKTVAKAK